MKLQRFFAFACMIAALGLIASCSGEDGRDGIDGTNGTNGTNGIDGTNGTNGTNGTDGMDGANGLACWDLDGDGVATIDHNDETTNEDLNFDNEVDALDCQGERGDDGADGVDGNDGADGNANVRRLILTIGNETPAGTTPVIMESNVFSELEALTAETLDTHAVLAYAYLGQSTYVPLPGSFSINGSELRFSIRYEVERVIIEEFEGLGWTSAFEEIHLILIEQSSSTGGNGGGGAKTSVDPIASLKAQGVDTSNYHEVMAYLTGLN